MKKISTLLFLLSLMTFSSFGQEGINALITEGVELHDKGDFKGAIKKYDEALALDKKSSLINYELAYSYFALKNYKKAVKYLDVVLKNDDKYLKDAYVLKGSAQDYAGKVKEAIRTYEKGITKFPDDYLLYFNLALTEYNNDGRDAAEEHLISSLSINPIHPTSNYLLGVIKAEQGRRVESMLAIYWFLMIEPDTKRSEDALKILENLLKKGIKQKGSKNVEINIASLGSGEEDDFSSIDMMISLLGATMLSEEMAILSEGGKFHYQTDRIFGMLQEQREGKEGIWWDLYADIFTEISKDDNLEAFCYYISQSKGGEAVKWMEDNEEKINKFIDSISEE